MTKKPWGSLVSLTALLTLISLTAPTAQAQPFAYVAHSPTGTISVLDTATNTLTGSLGPVPITGPIAVNRDGTRLYVPGHDLNLRVLDTTTNTVVATVPLGLPGQVSDIAINPSGTRVYLPHAAVSPKVMLVLDTASNSVIASVPMPERAPRVTASDTTVYLLNTEAGTVSVVDAVCNEVTGAISGLPSQFATWGIAVNPADTRLYVTTSSGLSVIDTTSGVVIATVSLNFPGGPVAVNPAGTRVYVAKQGIAEISLIDAATNTVLRTRGVGAGPAQIVVDPAGTRVYVMNQGNGQTGFGVSVLDTATDMVTVPVTFGAFPSGIAMQSGFAPAPPPVDPEPSNVWVTGIEVTQGIQDLGNRVPLISGRRTFARVHVKSAAPVMNVTATLTGAATQCTLIGNVCSSFGLGSITPINSVGPRITVRPNPRRSVLDESFLFELPWEWSGQRALQLYASLSTTAAPPAGPTCFSDVLDQPLHELQYPRFAKIQFIRLSYTLGGTNFEASLAEQLASESWMRRTYPLSTLVLTPLLRVYDSGLGSRVDQSADDCQDLAADRRNLCANNYIQARLASAQASTGFLALMRQRAEGSHELEGHAGDADGAYALIPQHPNTAWFTRGSCCTNRIGAGPSNDPTYAAHEIGHLFGRQHPVPGSLLCGHSADDDQYPYVVSLIGEADSDPNRILAGFDAGDGLGTPMTVRPFGQAYDYMGYCKLSSQWTSDYTYNNLGFCLREVGSGSSAPVLAGCGDARANAPGADGTGASSGDFLLAFGDIDAESGMARLLQTQRVDRIVSVPPREPGGHSIRLLDENGAALADYPFTPTASAEGPATPGSPPPLSFGHVVPFVAGTREIQIVDATAGMVVGTKAVSASPPLVGDVALEGAIDPDTGLVTLGWTASDPDGDALTFDIFLTRDGGASFLEPLMLGLAESSIEIDTSGLAGGSAQLRVVASDGIQTASADSPPFLLADKPPRPQILAPADGTNLYAGQLLNLEGRADDPLDGVVAETGLTWSTPAGPLGTGARISVDTLPVGTHAITLTATNTLGRSAEVSVDVTVGEVVLDPGPTLTAGPTQIGWHVEPGETEAQTAELYVGNSGSGDLVFTAQSSAPWLTLGAATATAPWILTLAADPSGIAEGVTVQGSVTLTAVGFPGQAIVVPVSLGVGNTFSVPTQECVNGVDDDGDGRIDLVDPGCDGTSDVGERSLDLPCDDGLDNDHDGRADTGAEGDLGCFDPTWPTESPQCQDGRDNDGDGGVDFDGGASAGAAPASSDSRCGRPYVMSEAPAFPCGIGPELLLLVPGLAALRARRQR